jgi:hypothetical protein
MTYEEIKAATLNKNEEFRRENPNRSFPMCAFTTCRGKGPNGYCECERQLARLRLNSMSIEEALAIFGKDEARRILDELLQK